MIEAQKRFVKKVISIYCSVFAVTSIIILAVSMNTFAQHAEEETQVVEQHVTNSTHKEQSSQGDNTVAFAFITAAAAFGLGAIAAGIAISNVGAAAMGAVAEKPEIAGQALIFVALAEGLVVFGFITALMILGKV